MKALRRLSTTLFLLCLAEIVVAQDVIVMKDQTTVMSKVLEITSTEIKYKNWNNQDGPTYSVLRSEVVSINYENGEVENVDGTTNNQSNQQDSNSQQVQYLNSYMTSSDGWLYLNGRPLSDNEIRNLVGQEGYQQYLKGRKLGQTGIILDVIGGASILVALAMRLFNSDLNTLGPSTINTPAFKTYITAYVIGGASLGTGLLVGIFGSEKLEKVAETYNNKHGNSYSLNISPSLLQYEIPQSQNNYGLGLTFSMNF